MKIQPLLELFSAIIQRSVIPLLAGLSLTIILGTASSAWANNIAIVVHRDVEEDNLDIGQVRRILLGNRQYWSPSQRITLLVPAASVPGRDVLLRSVYEMTDAQYRHYWIAKVFRAESTVAPQLFFSKEMAIKLINSIPGAIAIVDASEIPKDLKVLKVNGYLPGDQEYPLR